MKLSGANEGINRRALVAIIALGCLVGCGGADEHYAACSERCDPLDICEGEDRTKCTDECIRATSGRSEACVECILTATGPLGAKNASDADWVCIALHVGSPYDMGCRDLCGTAP